MQFVRMPIETFAKLLRLIEPDITKQNTRWRDAISAHDRLCLTLRFLATGETFPSLSYTFRVGRITVTKIVRETCFAIWKRLKGTYMKVPQTEEEWQNIAEGFFERWQLPNCCGSIDGKHIVLQCPANTGSLNYNYKGRFSKILMAVADAHYKFIYIDFGHYGSESDGGVFQKCTFGKKIINQTINLPKDANLPNSDVSFPYYFVADEAFPLRRNIMRPYPRKSHFHHAERIFNYRLSRARRVVENAFGILASRFRIFLRSLNFDENVTLPKIVAASLVLHNFLLTESSTTYCPTGFVDTEDSGHSVNLGQWRDEQKHLHKCGRQGSNTYSCDAKVLRDKLAQYLCTEGAVAWQDSCIYRGLC
ncbi:uncharacterized protein [Centruroides vittatus]|uniref:uncharacterized protein n=1 Tax=Centruroides vittatus TaxID=120091 RepID=UPI00350EFC69